MKKKKAINVIYNIIKIKIRCKAIISSILKYWKKNN